MEISNSSYSIGVVTYLNRYHTYFKPNIRNLLKYFPNKQIICIINGHPDKTKHLAYMKEATGWLSTLDNVQYITFEEHQSLAKCWNWVLIMSKAENNLFLNDDILVKENFRQDFENHLTNDPGFFVINGSFSHFLLNKDIIKRVGWFDERFLGIGQEDCDYSIRLVEKGIELKNLSCRGIINYVAPGTNPSFQSISGPDGKYASINRDFLEKKWLFNLIHGENFTFNISFDWKGEQLKAALNEGMQTPIFYQYSLLNNDFKFAPQVKSVNNKFIDFIKMLKVYLKRL